MDKELKDFIRSNKILTIATVDDANMPWLCNVYYSSDDALNFYFISPEDNNHSKHILRNNNVSFSAVWFDENNLGNRKSIQGKGTCEKVSNVKEMAKILKIHLQKYPDWKAVINLKNILNKVIESKVYKISPSYIKFWNDELYGDEGTKEFSF